MVMRLLDLFCGAGGASMGYARAGFEVVGVDIVPQPRYPFEFVQADANTFPLDGFDAIHASPPCHGHSSLNNTRGIDYGTEWMLPAMMERLEASGLPYVVENVENAKHHMPYALRLCGSEFGLHTMLDETRDVWLRRHRLFESNVFLLGAGGCSCYGRLTLGVHGGGAPGVKVRGKGGARAARDIMGIDWMNRHELDNAIPPAYTEWIGAQLVDAMTDTSSAKLW